MTCPSCNKPPVSLLKFIFTFDRTNFICNSCGAKLKLGPRWQKAAQAYFWFGMMYAALLVLNGAAFFYQGSFPIPMPELILFGVVVEAVNITVFWGQIRYVVDNEPPKGS